MNAHLSRLANVGVSIIACFLLVGASTAATSERDLAQIAKKRAAEAAAEAQRIKPGGKVDQPRVEEVAKVGIERGRAEFERRAALEREKHAAAVAAVQQANDGDGASEVKNKPELSGRLVLAISSSMPDDMVREYMRQLDGIAEAIVVLRGFVGGAHTVAPTGIWIERVRRKQPACRECAHYMVEVVVDPLAYNMLDIRKVPAVTYLPGVQDLRHCDGDALQAAAVAYGATSLSAALKAVRAKDVAVPDELIRKVGG